MKLRYLFFILPLAFASCNNNGNKSDAYGNFEATEVIVSAQANGKLLTFNVDEGKLLKQGDLIGIIDTVDLSLKRQQLMSQKESMLSRLSNIHSQVEVFNQQKKNLSVDNDRIAKMFKDGAATKKQVDDIKGSMDVIDKQISSTETQSLTVEKDMKGIEKQIEQINESIHKSYIINDVNGTVLVKYTEPGEITAFGKSLYKIANLQDMILKVYVSGDQLAKVKIGIKCEVLVDKNTKENTKYEGIVEWVSDNAEFTPKIIQTKEERVNLVYAVKVKVKNDGTLKIGMPGEVNFK